MTKEEMLNLQNGQKVRIAAFERPEPGLGKFDCFEVGEVIIRQKDWLDCDLNVCFNKLDDSDFHFFYADEIELIEEEE